MTTSLAIVGGYLGSGKTTLINRLLAGPALGRTAVVVNDFGSVNVDSDLIAAAAGDTIELTNGCICCQVGDDVQVTMSALAARSDLDRVIFEVSGVGNPRQLARWRSFPGFTKGPILVCADPTNLPRLLMDQYVCDVVEQQLAGAEVLLVTKVDLASPSQVEETVAACRQLAPRASIHCQDNLHPPASGGADLLLRPPVRGDLVASRKGTPGTGGARASHSDLYKSLTLRCSTRVDLGILEHRLRQLGGELERVKGLVKDLAGKWHEVHLSAGRVSVLPRRPSEVDPDGSSLVLLSVGPEAHEKLSRSSAALRPLLPDDTPPGLLGGSGQVTK